MLKHKSLVWKLVTHKKVRSLTILAGACKGGKCLWCTTTHHTFQPSQHNSSSHIVNPPNTHAYMYFYTCHPHNIQQVRNTPCRGPGAYSVNIWGQSPKQRQANQVTMKRNCIYMQAKNLQCHLKKVHGEYCTDPKYYCKTFAPNMHALVPLLALLPF